MNRLWVKQILAATATLALAINLVPAIVFAGTLPQEDINAINLNTVWHKVYPECGGSGTSSGTSSGKAFILGDSIAAGTLSELNTSLTGNGYSNVAIDAVASRTLTEGSATTDGLTILQNDASQFSDASAVIIELGANTAGFDAANIAKAIGIVKQASPNAKIYWVNIGSITPDRFTGINTLIKDNASQGYTVVDWAAQVAQHPEYIDSGPNGYSVHPIDTGKKAFADSVANGTANNDAGTTAEPTSCCASGSSTNLSGADNAEKIWGFFRSKGLTAPQVAGMMGNMQAEAHFEPHLVQYGTTNSRGEVSHVGEPSSLADTPAEGGYGIVQFTPGWKILPASERLKMPPGDLLFQVTLIMEQLNGESEISEKAAGDALKQTTTVEEAVKSFEAKYERHKEDASGPTRLQNAIDILALYGSSSGGGTAGSGGCGDSLITGDIKNLAQQILDNANITYDYGQGSEAVQQLQGLTQGVDPGKCGIPVSPVLLGYILGLAQTHQVQISSLVRPGDACGTPHASGCAVDIDYFDKETLTGSNDKSIELIKAALVIFPPTQKLGFGTGAGLSLSQIGADGSQVQAFPDNPNHVHTDLRCWQK